MRNEQSNSSNAGTPASTGIKLNDIWRYEEQAIEPVIIVKCDHAIGTMVS